ncbi:MAG: hypothetical protein Q7T03_08150 [Deltaproteobacteria bacterium]|nr:hypothetical protein [Deltaproteobacteria bacterium]
MKTESKQTWVTNALIILATLGRLIPHPANMTPVGAMALVGGAKLDKVSRWVVPFLAMALSDALLGLFFHVEPWSMVTPFIYGAFAISIFLGSHIKGSNRYLKLGAFSIVGSLQFFAVTNFGVWLSQGMYPKTVAGLLECYAMALPFLQNTFAGDLLWSFGLFVAIEKAGAWLQEKPVQTASI